MKRRFTHLAATGLAGLLAVLLWLMVGTAWSAPRLQTDGGDIPYPNAADALQAAAGWLVNEHQNDDGGYSSFSNGANQGPSDAGGTVDAMLALGAAGVDVGAPLGFLQASSSDVAAYVAGNGGQAGKAIMALTVSGADPADFEGYNFVISLTQQLSPTGQYNAFTAFDQSLAMQGLATAGEAIADEAIDWLVDLQAMEEEVAGSWDDGFGTAGNPDATAMAIVALLSSGQPADGEALSAAVSFLAGAQLPGGGWEYGPDFGENANSTALVMGALIMLGEDVFSADGPWAQGEKTPLAALLRWQAESGAFQADFGNGRFDNFFSTVQSLPAVAMAASLGAQVEPEPTSTAAPTDTSQPPTATLEPTAEPTTEPEPTKAPPTEPAVTELAAETGQPQNAPEEEAGEGGPAVAGGDSTLPYWLLGGLVVLMGGFFYWFYRGRVRRQA